MRTMLASARPSRTGLLTGAPAGLALRPEGPAVNSPVRQGRALAVALTLLAVTSPLRAADTGTIRGTIDKPANVKSVTAINRENDKKFPAKIDAKSGDFVVE